jgi:hypothetical protein
MMMYEKIIIRELVDLVPHNTCILVDNGFFIWN